MTEGNDPEQTHRATGASRLKQTTRRRLPAGLAVILAVAVVALTACGGSGSPHVASLSTNATTSLTANSSPGASRPARGATTTTTLPQGNPTVLLDEWAACMRSHGDTDQADPTVDANEVIHITWNPETPGGLYGTNKGGQGNSGPGQYCRSYLSSAQTALRGGQGPEQPDPTQLEKYSQCMRANGVPDFPDPSDGNLSINRGGDIDPSNPTFQAASKVCSQKTGVQGFGTGTPQPGMIEFNSDGQST